MTHRFTRDGLIFSRQQGTTQTNGKFNARAVAAFHLASAQSCRAHCMGPLANVVYQPSHEKMVAREAIKKARAARVQSGIYRAGDFHEARLP